MQKTCSLPSTELSAERKMATCCQDCPLVTSSAGFSHSHEFFTAKSGSTKNTEGVFFFKMWDAFLPLELFEGSPAPPASRVFLAQTSDRWHSPPPPSASSPTKSGASPVNVVKYLGVTKWVPNINPRVLRKIQRECYDARLGFRWLLYVSAS